MVEKEKAVRQSKVAAHYPSHGGRYHLSRGLDGSSLVATNLIVPLQDRVAFRQWLGDFRISPVLAERTVCTPQWYSFGMFLVGLDRLWFSTHDGGRGRKVDSPSLGAGWQWPLEALLQPIN